ncbi:DUF1810 domain-containing protein [Vineibacter terrae]|uniref:DUF1810 domain-containing protein n=1 Tax=Vineibacter terrae TaxID=2586908 RepID=A0A5C8PRT7_9HYPH|nr:DUF1810 domain-containing protein [Vineibacter terrae]TXL78829.1 DUF1810 domain-containing protein [Vineibacter terrae]
MAADPHNLQRFVEAQDPVVERVLAELRAGSKRSHWMWFIFPQVKGLGRSGTAWDFAIGSRREAEAYLAHPVLGPRLRQCSRLLADVQGRTAHQILGTPDDLKCQSSMTLFAAVAADNAVFEEVLQKYFAGERCEYTLDFLTRY